MGDHRPQQEKEYASCIIHHSSHLSCTAIDFVICRSCGGIVRSKSCAAWFSIHRMFDAFIIFPRTHGRCWALKDFEPKPKILDLKQPMKENLGAKLENRVNYAAFIPSFVVLFFSLRCVIFQFTLLKQAVELRRAFSGFMCVAWKTWKNGVLYAKLWSNYLTLTTIKMAAFFTGPTRQESWPKIVTS